MVQRSPESLDILRGVSLFKTLEDDQLRPVRAVLRERRYRKGATIFNQEDEGNCLYIITSGHVRIYVTYPDGRESTLRIYDKGTSFGEFAVLDGGSRSASAAALDEVSTLVLFREDFLQLLEKHFNLVTHILTQLTERLRYTTRYAEQQVFLTVPGRIATVLLQLAGDNPEPITLKWTQSQLATFANTSREWVSKTLNSFADQGLVRLERGAVVVLSRSGLRMRIS